MPPASAVAAFPTSPDFSPQPSIIVGSVHFYRQLLLLLLR